MSDQKFMEVALAEAAKGVGATAPNPMVGAVVVKDGRIIGRGYHQAYGEPHAEVNAIQDCAGYGWDTHGATLYVTLEPCCHYGKTPPCTEAIIAAQIARVVIGVRDTNKLVAGKGIESLRQQGTVVEVGVMEDECRRLNEIYFHCNEYETPFVLMKYAMTADGKIATTSGLTKWITAVDARGHAYQTRSRLTAIMTGIGTVAADNPGLSSYGIDRDLRVIICDSGLQIGPDCDIVQRARERDTYIATLSRDPFKIDRLRRAGVKVLQTGEKDGSIDLVDLMKKLYALGIDSILLEGGGRLNSSALGSGIVQRLHLYIGAKIFGGVAAFTPVEGPGVGTVGQACRLTLEETQQLGDDLFLNYTVRRSGGLPQSFSR